MEEATIKFLLITDRQKPHKLAHKLFGGEMKTVSGNEIERIIQSEIPDYVFFNLKSDHEEMGKIIEALGKVTVHSFGFGI
ncbi:MAG: hypothetical protein UR73_C0037G0013 [candidate division WS6 bacterium GW2011_GWF1_35_23]|uniref:Uncharacterized protein n=1 Tax=candidate division WS6 bacterium GW2011_GWF1_35_23 TaxID=1619097 RepID=A0A0G0BZA1_9BACT|nr:MAG: hypothetical protein UR73_C0037G0013 [candidate division WS6 bacterium GW2011_GWF1_35_23]